MLIFHATFQGRNTPTRLDKRAEFRKDMAMLWTAVDRFRLDERARPKSLLLVKSSPEVPTRTQSLRYPQWTKPTSLRGKRSTCRRSKSKCPRPFVKTRTLNNRNKYSPGRADSTDSAVRISFRQSWCKVPHPWPLRC